MSRLCIKNHLTTSHKLWCAVNHTKMKILLNYKRSILISNNNTTTQWLPDTANDNLSLWRLKSHQMAVFS
jgi:hypothetical protein